MSLFKRLADLVPVSERMETQSKDHCTSFPLYVVEKRGRFGAWNFVTVCLTQHAAERFIERHAHNLRSPRIFVYSGNGNEEIQSVMLAVRAISHPSPWDCGAAGDREGTTR